MDDLTNIYAKCYADGEEYVHSSWPEAGEDGWRTPNTVNVVMTAGHFGGANYVTCIKFVLPAPAKSVTFGYSSNPQGYTEDKAIMNYKFTSAEDASLRNAKEDTPGDGTITINIKDYARNTLTFQRNLSAGVHYLYIWTTSYETQYYTMRMKWCVAGNENDLQASYEAIEHYSRIQTAEGVKLYQSYVRTAAGDVLHAPWVKTADGCKPLS